MNNYEKHYRIPLTASQLYKLVPGEVRKRIDREMFGAILIFWVDIVQANSGIEFDIIDMLPRWHYFATSRDMFDYFVKVIDFHGNKPKSFEELAEFLDENGFYFFGYENGYLCYDAGLN